MTQVTVTEKEATVLVAMLNMGIDCCGMDTPEDMKDDNMTWADVRDIRAETGLPAATIKGVLGTLTQKGLTCYDEKPNGQPGFDHYLSYETGIDLAFRLRG